MYSAFINYDRVYVYTDIHVINVSYYATFSSCSGIFRKLKQLVVVCSKMCHLKDNDVLIN
jgi:hypothetical protein